MPEHDDPIHAAEAYVSGGRCAQAREVLLEVAQRNPCGLMNIPHVFCRPLTTVGFGLCLLLAEILTSAHALTLEYKSAKLSTSQLASLKRLLAESSPALIFDWNSLKANYHSTGRKQPPLSVTLRTVPALTPAGACRSEQRHFQLEAGKGGWRAIEDLTSLQAWAPQGADCAQAPSPISVDKSLTDADLLFIERGQRALRNRAAQVIGGSDCARVRFCEVTLRRISRVRQESPARVITKLTFSPVNPGPDCLYVMELSFVGALKDLAPLGASCPLP